MAAGTALAAAALTAAAIAPAAQAFGTIHGAGQNAEHERITRAALACPPGKASDGTCFESVSLDQLAGTRGTAGAVGSPDSDQIFNNPQAHCDNGDHLGEDVLGVDGTYPRTLDEATAAIRACVANADMRLGQGLKGADGIVRADGRIDADQVKIPWYRTCTFTGEVAGRAKCDALEGFGRGLHGMQDFYAHSNWVDTAAPGKPGVTNPPGLGRSELVPLFDLRNGPTDTVPAGLITGCAEYVPMCSGDRVGHDHLNKDNGHIDPRTGATSDPKTERGQVADNFDRAVRLAIAETRRQWRDFSDRLVEKYGARGRTMVCALTHDDAAKVCGPAGR